MAPRVTPRVPPLQAPTARGTGDLSLVPRTTVEITGSIRVPTRRALAVAVALPPSMSSTTAVHAAATPLHPFTDLVAALARAHLPIATSASDGARVDTCASVPATGSARRVRWATPFADLVAPLVAPATTHVEVRERRDAARTRVDRALRPRGAAFSAGIRSVDPVGGELTPHEIS